MQIAKSRFEEIILTPSEEKLFHRFRKGSTIPLSREIAQNIQRFGLIEQHLVWDGAKQLPWDGTFIISDIGQHYLQYLRGIRQRRRMEWLRYIITTVIALIALILSVISIAAETGLLKLPQA